MYATDDTQDVLVITTNCTMSKVGIRSYIISENKTHTQVFPENLEITEPFGHVHPHAPAAWAGNGYMLLNKQPS